MLGIVEICPYIDVTSNESRFAISNNSHNKMYLHCEVSAYNKPFYFFKYNMYVCFTWWMLEVKKHVEKLCINVFVWVRVKLVSSVLPQNGWFCNSRITEQCLHNKCVTKWSQFITNLRKSNKKLMFFHIQKNIVPFHERHQIRLVTNAFQDQPWKWQPISLCKPQSNSQTGGTL